MTYGPCDPTKSSITCDQCGAMLQARDDLDPPLSLDDVATAHWHANGPWTGPCTAETPWVNGDGTPADPNACDGAAIMSAAPPPGHRGPVIEHADGTVEHEHGAQRVTVKSGHAHDARPSTRRRPR